MTPHFLPRAFLRATLIATTLLGLAMAVPTVQASHTYPNEFNPGLVHWDTESQNQAWVNFVDFTTSAWPVYASHLDWEGASNQMGVHYKQPGTCNEHCVWVGGTNQGSCTGAGDFTGITTVAYNKENGHLAGGETNTRVRMNANCAGILGSFDRRAAVCHELGHAAGALRHQAASSCMHSPTTAAAATPDSHDTFVLNQVIYDHAR